ncbi:MAG: tRNA (adenosine(37)-N6)-threonylcarbamoyltransferase complex transferase subunit TsaD [Candidatus Zixiibacteriota bacterium]
MNRDLILGIETSCDDTAACLIKGNDIVSEMVYSQIVHQRWGGVIPELASRDHAKKILPTVRFIMEESGYKLSDLDAISVTAGPGLKGSVLVGLVFAKALAYMLDIPIIGVNHLEAHIFGALIGDRPPVPFIAFLVSGGHTHLYLSEKPGKYKLLGKTRDDAAGEAFDKIAKFLGYSYPGGPHIERLANEGKKERFKLPIAMKSHDSLDFSFSGIKTAAITAWENRDMNKNFSDKDLAAGLQESISQTLINKLKQAIKQTKVKTVIASGGVLANTQIRNQILELKNDNVQIIIPTKKYCTDNAMMVAYAGKFRLHNDYRSSLEFSAEPNMKLENTTFAI